MSKRNYENNVYGVIQSLRAKGIVVNDTETTDTIKLRQDYEVQVPPKGIYVGTGRDIGHKTIGKIDFLSNYMGFTNFGWKDYTNKH